MLGDPREPPGLIHDHAEFTSQILNSRAQFLARLPEERKVALQTLLQMLQVHCTQTQQQLNKQFRGTFEKQMQAGPDEKSPGASEQYSEKFVTDLRFIHRKLEDEL